MRTSRSILAIATLFAAVACSDDGSGPDVTGPTLSYPQAAYVTPFFTIGTTGAPTVNWRGEPGTLSIVSPVTGATFHGSTGEVSWNESLPVGVNTVLVVAANSVGADTATVVIDNQFEGDFEGGFNDDPETQTQDTPFAMIFNANGNLRAFQAGVEMDGTWSRDGITITAVFTPDGSTFFTFQGDLIHDTSGAALEGLWYQGDEPVEGNEEGYMGLALEVTIT